MSAGSIVWSPFGSNRGPDGVTVTFADFESPQPPALTAALSVSVPGGPAVNVIVRVPAPPVIAPPVIVHEYVAPAPASATEAVLDAPESMDGGTVIVAFGIGLTVTAIA